MADPNRRAGGRKAAKGDKKTGLAEVRRIVSEFGLTIEDVFPAEVTPLEPAALTAETCNPCFEQSAGLLGCNGTDPEVIPYPPGNVPVVPVFKGGVFFGWANATALAMVEDEAPPVEGAPPPRESGDSGEQTLM